MQIVHSRRYVDLFSFYSAQKIDAHISITTTDKQTEGCLHAVPLCIHILRL